MEKTYCKVIEIDKIARKVIFEMYFPNGEVLRGSKSFLYDQLEKKGLCEEGAPFYFICEEVEDGVKVSVESYVQTPEEKEEIEKLYKELDELLKDSRE